MGNILFFYEYDTNLWNLTVHLQQPPHDPDHIPLNNMLYGLWRLRENSAQHACGSLEGKKKYFGIKKGDNKKQDKKKKVGEK